MRRNDEKTETPAPEAANDFEFLQEKIKERPIDKKKLLKRTIITASMAVLFGLLACLSFLLLEPVLNNWLYPEEEPEVVAFPQEQNEMLPEDMLTEGTTASEVEARDAEQSTAAADNLALTENGVGNSNESDEMHSTEERSDEISSTEAEVSEESSEENPIDKPIDPLKPYQAQYEELYAIYRQVEPSMVTVTAVRSNVDWFNNTYQSEGTTAGVIIANNNKELLILSRKSSLDGAEKIQIGFCDKTSADAVIKQYDSNTDLAVLAVELERIDDSTMGEVTVASLGSSISSGITGTPIIAIGNLFGYKDSVCYGMVTSKENIITMADSEYKMMTTDIYAGTNPSGILINMRGEVIGVINNSYNHDDTKNLLSAIGITELKGLITKLSNGEHIPYIGIYAQNISAQTRDELGLPQGAYIVDIAMDSPAMLKGIQKGDILVRVGTQDIKSASDYMNILRNLHMENSIDIVVQRASGDTYEEMRFVVQPG